MNYKNSHSLSYLIFTALLGAAASGCGDSTPSTDAAPPGTMPPTDAAPPGDVAPPEDVAPPDTMPPASSREPDPASMALTVVSTDGTTLTGAVVRTGQGNATAGEGGRVLLEALSSGELQYTVAAEGYAPFVNTVLLDETTALSDQIKLLPVATFERDAELESSIEHDSVNIVIPADALTHQNGDAVTGTFTVELVRYTPRELGWDRRPGELIGVTTDGGTQYLNLYGAFSLTLRQGQEELEIDRGQMVRIDFAIDMKTCEALGPETSRVPLWSITAGENEQWTPEDDAPLHREADGTCTVSFEVEHVTWWAVADPYAVSGCFDVTLVDIEDSTRRPNLKVTAAGDVEAGTFTYDEAFTDADGRACVNTEGGGTVRLSVGIADAPLWQDSRVASGPEASCQSDRSACEPVMIMIEQANECLPGSYRDCGYDGPSGTEDVGECRAGRDYCDLTGTGFLGCVGSVVPQTEICGTAADEDCDGKGSCVAAVQVVAGSQHTCSRLDDGTVKCWGYSYYGGLGLGDQNGRGDEPEEMGDNLPAVDLGTGRTAQALAAGDRHTCALLDDNIVKCWGGNSSDDGGGGGGQLGLGDQNSRGDEPGEMGDNLPAVDLGTGRTAQTLAAGWRHTCALLDDGTVKCWGTSDFGQLGLGDQNNRGDEPGEMGDNLAAVALGAGRTARALAAGWAHTCALLDDGTVKCWGANGEQEPPGGQLGLGHTFDRGDEPGEMGDNLPAVDLGTGRTTQALAAGDIHTCAVLDNGFIKCWGYNFNGQLGLGDTNGRGDGPGEMGDALPGIDLGSGP